MIYLQGGPSEIMCMFLSDHVEMVDLSIVQQTKAYLQTILY